MEDLLYIKLHNMLSLGNYKNLLVISSVIIIMIIVISSIVILCWFDASYCMICSFGSWDP